VARVSLVHPMQRPAVMGTKPVRTGSIVARRYRATRRIASGAMGEVWEGVHVELGHRVALKLLRRDALGNGEMVLRFAREAYLLARVQSEHVVRVVDFVPRGRYGPVLVMDHVEGPNFADVLRTERVSLETIVDVAIDVLQGLRAMHAANVIHRDVKPSNVVLRRAHDGRRRAMLIDLGVGRLAENLVVEGDLLVNAAAEITSPDRVVGTLEYMPPEQITSCQTAGFAVDIYAVGAMIYRAVNGAHPFGQARGSALLRQKVLRRMPRLRTGRRDAAGKKLEDVVARAVEFSPKDRWPTAAAMIAALEGVRAALRASVENAVELDPRDVELIGPPPLPGERARALRRRKVIAVAAACATALAACSTDFVRHPTPAAAHQSGVASR
jgi:serine/threonine protein kinase